MTSDVRSPWLMIVGGNPDDVDILMRQLDRHGYPCVVRVGTADEAAAQLWPKGEPLTADAGAAHLPDALLLDLGLAVLDDGHSLLRHVRRSPGLGGLPVLMLVGRHPAALIRAAVQDGASGFIQRPFDGLEVVYKMEQAMSGARAAELVDLARDDPAEQRGG